MFLNSIKRLGFQSLFYWTINDTLLFPPLQTKTLNELSTINIFYTKLIQWISDNNVHNEEISNYIKIFTNNVKYNQSDIDYKSLLELNLIAHNNGDKLVITDLIPINSGTISLVFKGLLNDKPIVIKLLRKDINKTLKESVDLDNSIPRKVTTITYKEQTITSYE